jgi:hypothetical protein
MKLNINLIIKVHSEEALNHRETNRNITNRRDKILTHIQRMLYWIILGIIKYTPTSRILFSEYFAQPPLAIIWFKETEFKISHKIFKPQLKCKCLANHLKIIVDKRYVFFFIFFKNYFIIKMLILLFRFLNGKRKILERVL